MRALIYAHFDRDSVVDPHIYYQLRCLRPHFDLLYFVSACRLGCRDLSRLVSLTDRIICRENVGYDFMSWRTGFEALPIRACNEVSIMNDSCYGPIFDLNMSLDAMDHLECDLAAMTINYQFARHAQSNFIRFGRRLLRTGFASAFWRSVEIIHDKAELINKYEVGLSTSVAAAGFSVRGLIDYANISDEMRERVIKANEPLLPTPQGEEFRALVYNSTNPNPNHTFWSETMAKGSPLLKVELLRDNPLGANIGNIKSLLKRQDFYDIRLIQTHLERVAREK